MDKNKRLDIIANGIHAAGRLHNIRSARTADSPGAPGRQYGLAEMNEILRVFAEYSPEQHGKQLSEAINKGGMYIGILKSFMDHIDSARNQSMDKSSIIRTLDIVKPIVGNEKKLLIDKILQLYDIFYSWP